MNYLTIDIETRAGNPDDAEAWMRRFWEPDARWTPETIGKRYLEGLAKTKQRLALLDSAGIAVVALTFGAMLETKEHGTALIHCLSALLPTEKTEYGIVESTASERHMLCRIAEVIERNIDESTVIVGHNVRGFDLPRLRLAYIRTGLAVPAWLGPEQPTFDIMREFVRAFSVERQEFISFDEVMRKLGMESHKGVIDGSQIGALMDRGEVEAVLRYASMDVQKETEAYLLMTGQLARGTEAARA